MEKKTKGLSAWKLTMMALGTVIGGSFFLGSAVAIRAAGPSVLISFIFGGVLVYFILFALSEMTVANPDAGSFRTFASQAFGPGAGFIVGRMYWSGMVLAMSSEATAVTILIQKWFPGLSIALVGSIIIIGVTLLNLLGADKLSRIESGLAAVKLIAIVSFIIIALLLIIGVIAGKPVGLGELAAEPLMPGGLASIGGSMLIVLFSYAGFEIIGLAASEADNPRKTVPRAIAYTVISLVGLYILSVAVLLPLIPTAELNESMSPMVAALNRWGIGWAVTVINLVLVSAILSTMLAAMFGLGRMMRSLAQEGLAPKLLKDKKDVPYRGILCSGFGMLLGLGIGLLFPNVYLFLVSSSGFTVLFTYAVIMATHIRYRKKYGCPPEGKCQLIGYPYTSWFVLLSLIIAMASMPTIAGQASGLLAGLIMTAIFSVIYMCIKLFNPKKRGTGGRIKVYKRRFHTRVSTEFSEDILSVKEKANKNKADN